MRQTNTIVYAKTMYMNEALTATDSFALRSTI